MQENQEEHEFLPMNACNESTSSLSAVDIETQDSLLRKRSFTFRPVGPPTAPVVLSWKNLLVTVTKKGVTKTLLNNINGSINGGFWAIMGASGGGKTTLLSTLSMRLNIPGVSIEGDVALNGRSFNKHLLKSVSAYVMQDDLLFPELTVEQTLTYAARLRLARGTSNEEIQHRVDQVLGLMGIRHTRQVIIGDTRKKGISGGERKRVCVAMELLNQPSLIFLDEPTSGLDSSTALSVCRCLKDLSDQSICTVVCTIHQPQQKIFNLFDNLILMKKGEIIYQGGAQKSLLYFEVSGFPCPPEANPADHLLDILAPKPENEPVFPPHSVVVNIQSGNDKPPFKTIERQSWLMQVYILLDRCFWRLFRRYDLIVGNVIVSVVIAIFISLGVWKDIGESQTGVPFRGPSLFFCVVSQGVVASLQSTTSFPMERALMLRERSAGTYNVSAYFLAKSISDMLVQMIPSIIFSCIVYPSIGYQPNTSKFFIFMFFMITDTMAATSLAIMLSCLCVSLEMTTVVMSLAFEICRLYGGFFISPLQMTEEKAWQFAEDLSYLRFAFVGVAINEFSDLKLHCLPNQLKNGQCPYTEGEQVMKLYGYNLTSLGFNIGFLLCLIIGFRFVAYLALRFIKN